MTLQILHPQTVDEAVALLRQHGTRAVPLAGGTWLTPRLRDDIALDGALTRSVDTVVDLGGLPLRYIRREDDDQWLAIGALARLADLAEDAGCQTLAGGILAEAARRAGPVNLRNSATVGGCVASGEPANELLLALAALAAVAVPADGGEAWPVQEPQPGRLVAALRVPAAHGAAGGGLARVARTPSDQPIVAAAAVATASGVRVAIGGVAEGVLTVTGESQEALERGLAGQLARQRPISDFRGSAEYRLAMAPIVARRAANAAAR